MLLCTIKMFEGELTEAQAADLIKRVMEAIIPFVRSCVAIPGS